MLSLTEPTVRSDLSIEQPLTNLMILSGVYLFHRWLSVTPLFEKQKTQMVLHARGETCCHDCGARLKIRSEMSGAPWRNYAFGGGQGMWEAYQKPFQLYDLACVVLCSFPRARRQDRKVGSS